ncbi:MAG: hypothetical protein AAGF94_01630 [Pseudomonadota bacterium]
MRLIILWLCLLCVPAAAADRPISAEEFDRYTRGKTLFYGVDGVDYGVEEYLNDRRVRWAFLGDECVEGYWYAEGSNICFAYEAREGVQCWQFFLSNGRLTAQSMNEGSDTTVYEINKSSEPMICLGPQIGV